jgi:starch phosphorylase
MSKASMKSILPQFNSQRMVMDYVRDFYGPASRQGKILHQAEAAGAKALAQWKTKVLAAWPGVSLRQVHSVPNAIHAGQKLSLELVANLNGLKPNDVVMECVVGTEDEHRRFIAQNHIPFTAKGHTEQGETLFALNLEPPLPGLQHYQLRMYPHHQMLSHPFETGCMIWL